MPIYVIIAVVLTIVILLLTMDSVIIPVFFLLSIGMAIIYNQGSNVFQGDKKRAMAHAIFKTITSVVKNSITTVAGFAALCFISFTLGMAGVTQHAVVFRVLFL